MNTTYFKKRIRATHTHTHTNTHTEYILDSLWNVKYLKLYSRVLIKGEYAFDKQQ